MTATVLVRMYTYLSQFNLRVVARLTGGNFFELTTTPRLIAAHKRVVKILKILKRIYSNLTCTDLVRQLDVQTLKTSQPSHLFFAYVPILRAA